MRILTVRKAFLVLMLVLISGCSPVQELINERPPATVKADSSRDVRARVDLALSEDSLVLAQQVLMEALRHGDTDRHLADLCSEVEAHLLAEALAAEEEEDFAKAGELYNRALNLYLALPLADAPVAMSRENLSAKLTKCADALMKRGLIAYRAGDLLSAVQTWKKIEIFLPDHNPSLLAIETAEQQIATLQKLAPVQAN